MAWSTIPDSRLAAGEPVLASDFVKIRDNIAALAEGTAEGAPQFQTAAYDSESITAPKFQTSFAMNNWVAARIASLSAGDVGTYAFATRLTATTLALGATVAGSDLRPATHNGGTSGSGTLSGTWRCMGYVFAGTTESQTTLFVRIV